MSFSKPPVVASSVALLAAMSLAPSLGWARDGRTGGDGGDIIHQMAPIAPDSENIIYQMPPLKPVKGAMAQAPKAAPKPAQQAEPLIAAKPAPAPAKESAAAPPAPIAQAPVAVEAPQPLAEAAAPAAEPEAVAEQPAPATPDSAPVADAQAEGSSPAAPQLAHDAPATPATAEGKNEIQAPNPAEQPVAAEAPVVVEPAPIGPPIITINPPRKGYAAIKAPVAALPGYVAAMQGDSGPSLSPKLRSLAPEPEQAVAAAEPVAQAKAEAPQPQPEVEAAASAPAEPAASQAAPDARISALLAQGLVGPVEVRLGDRATMWLPAGRVFLPQETARKLAQEAGLDWRPGAQGMVTPKGGNLEWLAPIELIDDGHIATGGAEALQPDKLLTAFQASLPEVNAQRARAGQPPVTLDGWLSPPALNEKHRLAGCTNISTGDGQNGPDKFFNCEAWALGRQGAIKVGLADSAEQAARLKDEAAALADTIVFDRDKSYEAFDPATDKTAPYTAADLLTRDVTAKTPPAVAPAATAAEQAAPAEASSGLMAKLFYPAVFGVGALALYALIKRRRDAEKDEAQARAAAAPAQIDEAPEINSVESPIAQPTQAASLFARLAPTLHARFAKTVDAPKEEIEKAAERPLAQDSESMETPAQASARSLLERLLPSLHARFTKKADSQRSPEAPNQAALDDAIGSTTQPAAKERGQSAVGGLIGKISALRARDAEKAKPATPANDAEEPATALKKLAARMRRKTEEPAPPPVNVSRALRPARSAGAATAVAMERFDEPLIVETREVEAAEPETILIEPELIEPNASLPFTPEEPETQSVAFDEEPLAMAPPEVKQEPPARQSTIEEDFGLIEPGDVNAAASAEDAARRLGH